MRIAITAGGTGGHIFPALSVAKSIQKLDSSVELVWFGTERNREREVCEKNSIPIEMLNVSGIDRRNPISAISAIIKMKLAIIKVYIYLMKNRVDSVIAFGGYVCAPVLIAAKLKGIPYYLQEQNCVPGLVNRLMSKWAVEIFLGLELAKGYELKAETKITGNPVREKEQYGNFIFPDNINRDKKTVLVCGGSQGAASMNKKLVEPVKAILKKGYQVIWQTGVASFEEIKSSMGNMESIYIYETLDDLYPYYDIADILIGRSGASTLAEAALFNLPAILIPLPWSAEDHQRKNAALAVALGWAIVVEQDDSCSENIIKYSNEILDSNDILDKMRASAKKASPEKSANEIAKKLIGKGVR